MGFGISGFDFFYGVNAFFCEAEGTKGTSQSLKAEESFWQGISRIVQGERPGFFPSHASLSYAAATSFLV